MNVVTSNENKEWLENLVKVRPSKRQLAWQQLEFTAFFHYGINSFSDKEWGDGKEDISVKKGDSFELKAYITPSDSKDKIVWKSGDTSASKTPVT